MDHKCLGLNRFSISRTTQSLSASRRSSCGPTLLRSCCNPLPAVMNPSKVNHPPPPPPPDFYSFTYWGGGGFNRSNLGVTCARERNPTLSEVLAEYRYDVANDANDVPSSLPSVPNHRRAAWSNPVVEGGSLLAYCRRPATVGYKLLFECT